MASFNLSDPTERLAQLPRNDDPRPPTDPAGLMVYLGRDMLTLPADLARVTTGSHLADLLRRVAHTPGPASPMPKVMMPAALGSTGKGGAIGGK